MPCTRPIRANQHGEIIIPNLAEVEVIGAEQFHAPFASALEKRKLAPRAAVRALHDRDDGPSSSN